MRRKMLLIPFLRFFKNPGRSNPGFLVPDFRFGWAEGVVARRSRKIEAGKRISKQQDESEENKIEVGKEKTKQENIRVEAGKC